MASEGATQIHSIDYKVHVCILVMCLKGGNRFYCHFDHYFCTFWSGTGYIYHCTGYHFAKSNNHLLFYSKSLPTAYA